VMIVLNGMVGLSLLIGAWRHREQEHNLQGSNAYLGVIIPLVVLNFVLPNFTESTPGPTFSNAQQIFITVITLCLYGTFLAMQTGRHRRYFMSDEHVDPAPSSGTERPIARHALLLLAYLLPALYLAEKLGHPVDYLVEQMHAPAALAGVIMALLVATPEAIGAVRAAMANHLQRSVNVFLGSVLSTIGLTVPAMTVVSLATGHPLTLGVEHADLVLLLLTVAVSMVTFSSVRTNVIQGLVHVILFATYIMLVVQG
jgi:Ca2+:H+ antiporter